MKLFIGTKIIKAIPMTRAVYNDYRGWPLPDNENGADDGFLVEYVDGGEANDKRHAGYISWSPNTVFDAAYQAVNAGISFGHALVFLQEGKKLARAGWNGKGMFVYLVPADVYPAQTDAAKSHFGDNGVPYNDYMALKGVDDTVSTWVPSINDCLAEDWVIVE